MTNFSEIEQLRSVEDISRRMAAATPLVRPAEFGRTVEGFGHVTDGAAIAAIRSELNLGQVRIVFDPEDEPRFERVVLPDGYVALCFDPQTEKGVTIAMGTRCETSARELITAFRDAATDLAMRLAEGQEIGCSPEEAITTDFAA